jgi:hypothetical protein
VIDVTRLVGLRIRLKRTIDVPCGTSGGTVVVIVAGPAPRAASPHCGACDRHRGWLPKVISDFCFRSSASSVGHPKPSRSKIPNSLK